jgi:hypothetical protein
MSFLWLHFQEIVPIPKQQGGFSLLCCEQNQNSASLRISSGKAVDRLRIKYNELFLVSFVSLSLGSFSMQALAETRTTPPKDNYRSTRATGMGGIGIAVADDGDAIFQNPAGIGREDGSNSKNTLRGLTMPNATVGVNKYTMGLVNTYRNSEDRDTAIKETLIASNNKEVIYGYFSAFPYITISRFQLGFLLNGWGEGSLYEYGKPQKSEFASASEPLVYDKKISAYGFSQTAIVAGFSIPYGKSGFSLGVTGRGSLRGTIKREFEANKGVAAKSSQKYSSELNSSRGLAGDVGMLYVGRQKAKPSVGLVVKDVADTYYRPVGKKSVTERDEMNIGLGASIRPPMGKSSSILFSAEVQRINDSRLTMRDRVKMGTEVGFGSTEGNAPFAIRAGYNLRSPSVGVGLDLLFFKVDLAYHGEAVSGRGGTKVDMRYLAKATVDLRL